MTDKHCGSCAHWNKETRKCRNKDGQLYGTIRDEFDYCPSFCRRLTARDDIVSAWQDMDHLLSVMNGIGDEITDREAFMVVSRAVWLVLDSTVRGIDKTEEKNG